jgi:hypothetical protein
MSSAFTPAVTANVQSIIQQFDANKDGQFSADEFAEFLSTFMRTLTGVQAAKTGTGAAASTASGVGTQALLSATPTKTASRLNDPLPNCPAGWDGTKWTDPSRQSIKYVAGRIMARYSPSDWVDETKREQILADFKTAGLNPTASGKDKCDFNDGAGPIDIVQSASTGGKAWQWLRVNEG